MLAWNGYHYLFGRSQAGLGNFDLVDRLLPRWVEQLEADGSYPYDFLYCESTHPVRVDNGPPDPRMPDFVERWNGEDRPYKMAFVTTTEFGRLLKAGHGNAIGTQRGDWTDHWTDGPGSSAYETGVNRATHEILAAAEAIEAWLRAKGERHWDAARAADTYENATLYDEHTWGAYSSIEAPDSLFTRAQWNRKSGFAYKAAMEAHDQLARAANTLAEPLGTKGPEGIFNLGDLKPDEAFKPSGIDEVLVINTLPWERKVVVEEPEPRGGAAPVGILDCFFNRGSGWGGSRPIPPVRRIAGTVPAMGYAFLKIATPDSSDLKTGDGHDREPPLPGEGRSEERRPNRIPRQGSRPRFRRRIPGLAARAVHLRGGELAAGAARHHQLRLLPSRLLHRPQGHALAAERRDKGHRRDSLRSTRGAPQSPSTSRRLVSARRAVTYALDAGTKSLVVDWMLDKLHNTDAEAVFVAFPFKLDGQRLHHRPQRHPGEAEPRPARWRGQGLVSAPALGRRQRRQARRHARAARRAARPSRRDHHRQVVAACSSRRVRRSCRGRSTITGWSTSRRARTARSRSATG